MLEKLCFVVPITHISVRYLVVCYVVLFHFVRFIPWSNSVGTGSTVTRIECTNLGKHATLIDHVAVIFANNIGAHKSKL